MRPCVHTMREERRTAKWQGGHCLHSHLLLLLHRGNQVGISTTASEDVSKDCGSGNAKGEDEQGPHRAQHSGHVLEDLERLLVAELDPKRIQRRLHRALLYER